MPARALNVKLPELTVRVQRGCLMFLFVCDTHRPLTFRPGIFWLKLKLTLAGTFRVKENVVPTGGRRLAELVRRREMGCVDRCWRG